MRARYRALAHGRLQGVSLDEVEVAIGAMWNNRLTRLKMEQGAIEMYRDDVRFERHQVRDAVDLRIGVWI
jgi:hypothetical protein